MLTDPAHLGLPANIDRFQAPFGALLAGANRLAVYLHENGIRVGARKDPQGNPAGHFRRVVESQFVRLAVGDDFFPLDCVAC